MLYNLSCDQILKYNLGSKSKNISVMIRNNIPAVEGYAIDEEITEDELNRIFNDKNRKKMFAVRSSMSDEDGKEMSLAGRYLTILAVSSKKEMKKAIKKVLKSGENAKYRAACIQEMVDSEISGVMFTKSPMNDSKIQIEASYGLGELLVSGKVKPDSFLINRENVGHIESNISNHKVYGIFCNRGNEIKIGEEIKYSFGKVRKVVNVGNKYIASVPHRVRNKSSLTISQIKKLCDFGLEIERLFGAPQDIEWSIENGEIRILQSRPIVLMSEDSKYKDSLVTGELKGTPASIGKIQGEVSINKAESSKILVAYELTPQIVYEIYDVKGIITELGGALCHAAIVAREYNIPCIVGVDNILKVVKNGDTITMDGSTGYINLDSSIKTEMLE